MSDPYEDHELRDAWNEFKYYTEGVSTARMQTMNIDGLNIPCVKVFVKSDSSEEVIETVYEKADEMGLIRYKYDYEEEQEHIFILEGHLE